MVESWKKQKLGNLAEYINGYAFKPIDWIEYGIPIIRIEQLNNHEAKCDFSDKILPEEVSIDTGDLIFSWSATLSLKIWDRGKAYLNQHLFKVVPKEKTNKLFLKYLIEFNLNKLAGETHGSTMKHITRPHLLNFSVNIPSDESEQDCVSKIIFKIDEAVKYTEALITKNELIKKGLMQDLFTRGIDEKGAIRYKKTHKFKDSSIGRISEECDVKELQSVGTILVSNVDKKTLKGVFITQEMR